VTVQAGERLLHGETLDVGPYGAKLRLEGRLEDGTVAMLQLHPPEGLATGIEAVVWRTDNDGPVFFFLNTAPTASQRLP
jgi:hypothetical protein